MPVQRCSGFARQPDTVGNRVGGCHDVTDHVGQEGRTTVGFEARTDEQAGHVQVTLSGECDLAVRDQLHTILEDAVRLSPHVVVDLAAVDFLDSSGVHGLIVAHHAAGARGGRVTVVNPTGAVASVLDITGVAELLGPQAASSLPADQARADG